MFFSKKRLLQQGSFSYVSNAFYVFVKRNERRSVAKKGKIRLSLFYVKTVNRYKNIIVKLFPSGNNVVFGLNKKLYIYPSLSLVIICLFTLIFYKHMNFLAEAFAKHILCLFFSTKAFMCYVLNFFETKAFMCLFSQVNYIEKSLFWPYCACDVLIFFRRRLHVLNFFKKWAFMCL